jgi:isoleucyl-tRNA synthetase
VRQPLSRLVCVAPKMSESSLAPLLPILASELNVKRVEVATSADALVTLEAKANFRALGKKFGKQTPLAAEAVSSFTSEHLRRFEQGEELSVTVDGDTHTITHDDLTIVRRASGALVVQEEHGYFAAIDPAMTPELRQEGMARELISRVQRMRKDAGLAVSDGSVSSSAATASCWRRRPRIGTGSRAKCSRPASCSAMRGREGTMLARQRVDLDGIRADLALTKDE